MEEKPIFDFGSLKNYLESIGISVGKAVNAYHPVKPGDVRIEDIQNGTYTFESNGIFLNGSNGEHQQIFLYKRSYHLDRYGLPRMHIRKCSTIQDFIQSGTFRTLYRHANTATVPVIDMDNGYRDVNVSNLPLCQNCRDILIQEGIEITRNSAEFVEYLKKTQGANEEEQEDVDVDIFGYTKNWEQLSKWFREQHHYTCEKCGLQITNSWDYRFMHVHHINGNKADNKISNLQCLCIRCHSQVDEIHRQNFSEGANKVLLDEFNRIYPIKNETIESLKSRKHDTSSEVYSDLPF